MKIIYGLIATAFFLLLTACNRYPKDVRIALKDAGANRKELESVLKHYSTNPGDSLKLKAAFYLIGNLPDQYYIEGQSLDIYNEEITKIISPNVTTLTNSWDSIQRIYGNDLVIKRDINLVNSELLIENIDMAFKLWDKEWNRSLTFEEFCEYILPYKSANEKPEKGWRTKLYEKYSWVIDSSGNPKNSLDLCITVNKDFKDWFKINMDYQFPIDISYSLASKVAVGSCDMGAKTVMYPMRALGIPVANDYAPFWANRSLKHFWNSVIIEGQHKTFNGGGLDVGSHKIEYVGVGRMKYKPAKVMRRTYAVQKNTLPFLIKKGEDIPDIFRNTRIRDVTKDYIPVSDIHFKFGKKLPHETRFGYLCTFNNTDWQIYYWGERKKNELVFKDMGRDVAYLPVLYKDNVQIPLGDPFILTMSGEISICKADPSVKKSVKVTSKYPEDESNNIFPGQTYELLYWKDGWASLGIQVADTNYLIFDDAPGNALFWIRNHTEGKQERIFTYENDKQIWW
jgi:hypothetical protein